MDGVPSLSKHGDLAGGEAKILLESGQLKSNEFYDDRFWLRRQNGGAKCMSYI